MSAAVPPRPRSALPPAALSMAVAIAALGLSWRAVSIDMDVYLVPWFDHIVDRGRVAVFARPFGNYTPPYLYLLSAATLLSGLLPKVTIIKLLAVVGNGVLALAVRRLLLTLDSPNADRGAALVFALPTVLINGGVLGQADAWWAAACVVALTCAIERRHMAMLAWCGVAIAFKAQAAFVAPFFLALLIARRVPLWKWLAAPAVAVAMMLPAWLIGWPALDLATVYVHQADLSQQLSDNAPNIWMVLQLLPAADQLPLTAIAFGATLIASILYIGWFARRDMEGQALIAAALLAPLITAGLLPRMHDRFFFLADILSLVLALTRRDGKGWLIAMLIQAGSTLAICAFMFRAIEFAMAGALAMIVATYLLLRSFATTPPPPAVHA
jgi:Gpi18-like mannosyltransferase